MGSSLILCRVSVAKSAIFCAVFCRSLVCLFIFCYFLPLDCLSFFGLLFLVTPFGIFNFFYICLFIQRENIITYGRKRRYTWITYSFLFFLIITYILVCTVNSAVQYENVNGYWLINFFFCYLSCLLFLFIDVFVCLSIVCCFLICLFIYFLLVIWQKHFVEMIYVFL